MADEKKTYPFVNKKNWFALRKQFAKTMPAQITLSYLASVLDMSEQSARANVLGGLKLAGLVDGENKPTQRALRWRDDDQYPEVCKEIWEEVYPDELKALAPDSSTAQERIEKWFANKLSVGESSANKLASFYKLVQEADPTKENENTKTTSGSRTQTKTKQPKPTPPKDEPHSQAQVVQDVPKATATNDIVGAPDGKKSRPSLHIDIQIHISPESSTDQIEQIFASMAKHLKEI